uniref:Uncharacterized protein n=1 Tax=Pavo cristatus TaxID=9049 RepID=A0A8C9FXI2_PAVCR
MSLLQSALDFLAGPGTLGAASRDQNDFVGQTVEMGEMKLRIRRVIAEGKRGARWRRPGGAALVGGRWTAGLDHLVGFFSNLNDSITSCL